MATNLQAMRRVRAHHRPDKLQSYTAADLGRIRTSQLATCQRHSIAAGPRPPGNVRFPDGSQAKGYRRTDFDKWIDALEDAA